MSDFKPISRDAVPLALEKAEPGVEPDDAALAKRLEPA